MERRLTTIVAADIAGFSRLVGADEEGTLAAQRAHRAELIDPLLAKHNGRIANTAGDGMLVEFSSAVEAVRWATAMQEEMRARNADLPEDRRIKFRVGINVGDVVDEDGDLLGDGVNIAARLEALAPPGGVILSGTVHDQVRDRLDLDFADLGEVRVRNIARPVRAFQVLKDGETPVQVPKPKRGWPISASSMVMLLMIVAMAVVWYVQTPEFEPADPANMAYAIDDKPSIAVLAFDNLTGDPEQEHVSDGISEDIISTLARLPGLVVIARNSSFAYKGKPVDVRQIAEELSVRYVLEGSLQQSDDTIRITAQLVDAVAGHHRWSQRFDQPRADFFRVRDEITDRIVRELNIEIVEGNFYSHRDELFGSMETWLIGRELSWHNRKFTAADNRIANDLAQQVLAKEPNSVWAHEYLAWGYSRDARFRWSDNPAESLRLAETHAEMAIELDDRYPGGYISLSWIRNIQDRNAEAIALGEKALELAPGDSLVLGILAFVYQKDMQAGRAIELFQQAIRVNRKAPGWIWENYGEALIMDGRYDDAIPVYVEALKSAKGLAAAESHLGLAVAYDALGREDEAKAEIKAALQDAPRFSVAFLREYQRYKDLDYEERWLATLQRLGLPEG